MDGHTLRDYYVVTIPGPCGGATVAVARQTEVLGHGVVLQLVVVTTVKVVAEVAVVLRSLRPK
jgi:hypothetical protein